MTRASICILGLDDYGMLTGEKTTRYIGGESVQHVLLARAWRQLGMDVSIIVHDHGQPKVQEIDGIRMIAACGRKDGIPGLRFAHPLTTSLIAAMRRADADIYYQSLAGYVTGVTAWFCRRHSKHFVFRISSDAYCVPGRQLISSYRDRKVYEYGLRRADLILAQTQYQKRSLRTHYALDSELANLVAEPPAAENVGGAKDIDVLWVANFRPVKRPELVIELARRLPQVRFVVAGAGRPDGVERMRAAARELSNLVYVGPIAYDVVGSYFDRARVFLNTSSLEGFPNTFLQAWIRGVPVVTFFDPDGLVQREGLGFVARDLDEMAGQLAALHSQPSLQETMGAHAARYANRQYSVNTAAKRYLELFAASLEPAAECDAGPQSRREDSARDRAVEHTS
jgi:glycosyltransferase involved in cell wall biosynthesis